MSDIHNIAVRRLLSHNYNLYVSLTSDEFVIKNGNPLFRLCAVRQVYVPEVGEPYVRLTYVKDGAVCHLVGQVDAVIAVLPETEDVWLLPMVDCALYQTMRLGRRADSYKLEWKSHFADEVSKLDSRLTTLQSKLTEQAKKTAEQAAQTEKDKVEELSDEQVVKEILECSSKNGSAKQTDQRLEDALDSLQSDD